MLHDGNRLSNDLISNPGGSALQSSGYNDLNQLLNVDNSSAAMLDTSFVYDANGNMTQNTLLFYGSPFATVYYDWDAKDQLVGIRAPGYFSTEYTYDGQGRRVRIVEKDAAGTVTADRYFVWDGLRIAEERSSPTGPATKVFTSFGEIRGGTKYYYTRDHLGSVREVLDAFGNLIARYDYDPYGTPTQTYGSMKFDFLYTGHFYQWSTALYLAPYRAYNSQLGRWLNRDPIGMAGGMNLYGYVGGNPLNMTDPSGLFQWNVNIFNENTGKYEKLNNPSLSKDKTFFYLKLQCEVTSDDKKLNKYFRLLGYSGQEISDWFVDGKGPVVNIWAGGPMGSKGAYGQLIDGEINIFSKGLSNGKMFSRTLVHELGHYASTNSSASVKPGPVNPRLFTSKGIIELNSLNLTENLGDYYGYPAEQLFQHSLNPGIYVK